MSRLQRLTGELVSHLIKHPQIGPFKKIKNFKTQRRCFDSVIQRFPEKFVYTFIRRQNSSATHAAKMLGSAGITERKLTITPRKHGRTCLKCRTFFCKSTSTAFFERCGTTSQEL